MERFLFLDSDLAYIPAYSFTPGILRNHYRPSHREKPMKQLDPRLQRMLRWMLLSEYHHD